MDVADRFDRLETLIKKLAADVGDIRSEIRSEFRTANKRLENLEESYDSLSKDMQGLERIVAASTVAMTSMIRQTGVDKAVETRLRRLETAVFGSKH